ncbi:uncharacterized protein [Diabrotica undecimpunctata]|uniref:uncharacterized protein n=1 Tax=Diabrotica undecimpunctata TaxID=50387 RepID=UPI003B63CCE4
MLDNFQLNLLNDGRNTHFDISTGKSSAIDLSICDPALSGTLSWDVLSDLNDSDHFPIVITNPDSIQYSYNVEKWNIKNANWQEYYNLVLNEMNALHEILQSNNNIDSQIQEFSNVLLNAAEKAVGKMNSKQLNSSVPWWNSECQEAIKLSKTALNRFRKYNTLENKLEFKRLKARARFIIKRSKRESWKKFVSELNSSTPINKVWQMVRKISGKNTPNHINFLEEKQKIYTSPLDIANILANSFERFSSDNVLPPDFLTKKEKEESKGNDIPPDDLSPLNYPITMDELEYSLNNTKKLFSWS